MKFEVNHFQESKVAKPTKLKAPGAPISDIEAIAGLNPMAYPRLTVASNSSPSLSALLDVTPRT
jgi:hypothetical protein